MQKKTVTYDLPVKPHIAKYLRHHYGEVIEVSRYSRIDHVASYLRLLLRTKCELKQYEKSVEFYPSVIKISLSLDQVLNRGRNNINGMVIAKFHSYINSIFWNEYYQFMCERIAIYEQFGRPYEKVEFAKEFMKKYDINEGEDMEVNTFMKTFSKFFNKKPHARSSVSHG